MTVAWSLLAATAWGSGDFFGGVASRFGRATAVAGAAQVVGMVTVAVLSPLVEGSPTGADMAWGVVAGLSGGIGVLLLYRGMAASQLGLVVPISAIGTAAFPLLFGIATGERPSGLEVAGLLIGLAAIWLISYQRGGSSASLITGLTYGLGAGAGFGGLLIGLSRIADDAGIWPLAGTRLAGAVIIAAIAVVGREALVPYTGSWRAIIPAGSLGAIGNVFFLFAAEGSLAVAAVIGSLFPAATVVLARFVLKERLTATRAAGLTAGVLAVTLITVG